MTTDPRTGRARGWLLAVDTATSVVVVAAGSNDGRLLATRTFAAGHRHGTHLLPTIQALVAEAGLDLGALGGVIVGLGPGAFTGLRVGLATAKTLAHARGLPIVGISTAAALLEAIAPLSPGIEEPAGSTARPAGGGAPPAGGDAVARLLLLPAGPHDRVVVEGDAPARLEAGVRTAELPGAVAVDLDGRASEAAIARGRQAVDGLPAALVRLGAARLANGDVDDVERLVPAYVSLPRGVTSEVGDGGVAWSRDPR